MTLDQIIQYRMAGFLGRAAAYLVNKLGELNPKTAAKLSAGQLEVQDGEIIHTFSVTAGTTGGVTAVLDNSQTTNNKEVGVSDFDKGMLPEDSYLAVNRVILDYGGIAASYAPKTKTYLVSDIATFVAIHPDKTIGVLSFSELFEAPNIKHIEILSKSGDLREAASKLYRALHTLDDFHLDMIVAQRFPDQGLGTSINDRLERASKDA